MSSISLRSLAMFPVLIVATSCDAASTQDNSVPKTIFVEVGRSVYEIPVSRHPQNEKWQVSPENSWNIPMGSGSMSTPIVAEWVAFRIDPNLPVTASADRVLIQSAERQRIAEMQGMPVTPAIGPTKVVMRSPQPSEQGGSTYRAEGEVSLAMAGTRVEKTITCHYRPAAANGDEERYWGCWVSPIYIGNGNVVQFHVSSDEGASGLASKIDRGFASLHSLPQH